MANVPSVTSVRFHTPSLISSWGGIGGQVGFTPRRWTLASVNSDTPSCLTTLQPWVVCS